MKKILICAEAPAVNYIRALNAAGAEAVFAAPGVDFSRFDGLMLCGGGDVNPILYGKKNRGSEQIFDERDTLELTCIHAFVLAGKPILGVCRGLQILNVAFGGTLIQHLPHAENHTGRDHDVTHEIRASGVLRQLYGERFTANSRHHQAVDRPGRGLTPIAFSSDGVIEGMAHDTLPVLGVQFHPERMEGGDSVFFFFIAQCGK